MWPCPKCREKLDDDFDVCWNCGTSKDGIEDPNFRTADDAMPSTDGSTEIRLASEVPEIEQKRSVSRPLACPRCSRAMKFVGAKSFHEGTSWGAWGDLGEIFVNKESFDVYVCARCGRVEFFVTGIGDDLRPGEESE